MPGPEIGAAGLILASSLARGTAARTWVVPGQVPGLAGFIPAGPAERAAEGQDDQMDSRDDRPEPDSALILEGIQALHDRLDELERRIAPGERPGLGVPGG